jgi:hypothetical protein
LAITETSGPAHSRFEERYGRAVITALPSVADGLVEAYV